MWGFLRGHSRSTSESNVALHGGEGEQAQAGATPVPAPSPIERFLKHMASFSKVVSFRDMRISIGDQKGPLDRSASENCQLATSDASFLGLQGVERYKLVIVMVGLPGRGKTFLCNKLMCYLNW